MKERDEQIQDMLKTMENEQREHKENIPNLAAEYIAKGHEVICKSKWAIWDRIVPLRLSDIYLGKELDECLKIITELNRGCSLDEAKQILDKENHSRASENLVCTLVEEFASRGEEFVSYIRAL